VQHIPVPLYKALTFLYMCIESNLRPGGRSLAGIAGANAERGLDVSCKWCIGV